MTTNTTTSINSMNIMTGTATTNITTGTATVPVNYFPSGTISASVTFTDHLLSLCGIPKHNMVEKNGFIYVGNRKIMPSVKEIKPIANDKMYIGIKVIFSDDSVEKAICDSEDIFNYDYGLAICIMKRLFSVMFNNDEFTGTYYFNKIMDLAFRNNSKTFEEKVKADKEKEKEKRRREKNRLRKEKQKNAKREAAIEIQKEAYVRAMKELKEDN